MEESLKTIRTICGFCHTNCGLVVETRDGIISKITGDKEHPATKGYLCPKGQAGKELVYSPDRLQYPLKKTSGGFERISWDEALDTIAFRLNEIKKEYGPQTLVWCSGAPVTQEAALGFIQLVAAYGSANFTGPGHLCSVPRALAVQLVYGERSQPDYENTKCMLMWGSNPTDSRQLAERGSYGRFDRLVSRAKSRGAKLIVIDPKRTEIAAMADYWLQINVGTDTALGLAMLNVIIGENLYDKEFVDNWTVGFNELENHVKQFTPEWAEKITGIPKEKIIEVTRVYATTKPGLNHDGNGLDQHPNVIQTVRTLGILSAITGNVDVPGGNVFFPHTRFGHYLSNRLEVKSLAASKYPLFPTMPFPSVVDAFLTGEPYKPRAMIVHHANPLLINANEKKVRQALEQLEFMVVSDIFSTATAQMADIILPETSNFERASYETYASAQGSFVALRRKVVEPIGESRPVFDIEYDLAHRMGLDQYFPWKNTEEWIEYRLKPLGITLQNLEEKSVIYTTPPMEYRKYLKNGFNTPSKKVELFSRKMQDSGYSPLPIYEKKAVISPNVTEQDKFPLVGTTRKPGMYVHTRYRNLPRLHKMQPDPLIWIHEEDAQSRGISDGDDTTVESPEGSIQVQAKITTDVKPGTVVIDYGWGNPWDGKANVNILTSDTYRDPICGATSNRRFICEVKRSS